MEAALEATSATPAARIYRSQPHCVIDLPLMTLAAALTDFLLLNN